MTSFAWEYGTIPLHCTSVTSSGGQKTLVMITSEGDLLTLNKGAVKKVSSFGRRPIALLNLSGGQGSKSRLTRRFDRFMLYKKSPDGRVWENKQTSSYSSNFPRKRTRNLAEILKISDRTSI